MSKVVRWYSPKILKVLRRNFLPGAKYVNEPRISRYLRHTTKSVNAGSVSSEGEC